MSLLDEAEWLKTCQALGIPATHQTVGLSNIIAAHKDYKSLLLQGRMPESGWSDFEIQGLLHLLSSLDTNHKRPLQNGDTQEVRWTGVGEREGRCYSNLVLQRHFGLAHGMGRSGDLAEAQPKAVGSTVLAVTTHRLVLDVLRRGCGLHAKTAAHVRLLPLCTGMSLSLVLTSIMDNLIKVRQDATAKLSQAQDSQTLTTSSSTAKESQTADSIPTDTDKNDQSADSQSSESAGQLQSLMQPQAQPQSTPTPRRKMVLWCRIDQKSCFKSIQSAGCEAIVIPTCLRDDAVVTDMHVLQEAIVKYEQHAVIVMTTTSCFAPRLPDAVIQVSLLCKKYNVPHVINNAYGLQSPDITHQLNRACTIGRVDAIVCSMDKNFLVPVGTCYKQKI
jgi:O-phospho-L-seryl-tRNASec:L-selenocysteinyl-tRNA synthase